jgi:hypothetical protein
MQENLPIQRFSTQLTQFFIKMPETYDEVEERVLDACYELDDQDEPEIAHTAQKYNAPYD